MTTEESCDIRIWSEECQRSSFMTSGEKYLCAVCEKIPVLDHEVHHEIFPHVSGDADNLY
ncbi:MAG: hypothetical protein HYV06_05425 [Deltaproteobacteria bacterium]|nr:hypothetical protein [Deltaproteobacteria bacterium]